MPKTEVRGTQIVDATVSLTADVTGTLPVANGGTGAATITANNLVMGNGTSAVQVLAPGTSGNIVESNGSTFISATPKVTNKVTVASSAPGSPATNDVWIDTT